MLALVFAAPALSSSSTSLTWQRQTLVKNRHATLACQEARFVRRSPTDHAERSHSLAYLDATRRHWKARHANCERRLAKDRVRWRRDPVGYAKQIARHLLAHRGWSDQFWALDGIIMVESSWHTWALNPSSGACGIAQALPCSKMASMGADYRTSALTQLKWLLRYCENRYGDPIAAYHYRMANGSY